MSRRATLEGRIGVWFAVSIVVLYGVLAVTLWRSTRERGRLFAELTLKTEAEAVAAYIAQSGRTDAPELAAPELDPFPIWIRLVDGPRVVAATPGVPEVPAAAPEATSERFYLRPPGAAEPVLVVRHAVGGGEAKLRGLAVEAVGDITALRGAEDRRMKGLVLLGLVLIPVAALGGRLLARRALRPLAGLVGEIRTLDPGALDRRLPTPPRAVAEVETLATSFNGVLARLEASVVAMRQLTADASHEIRNPLSVMRTGIEVALRRERPADELRRLLEENLHEIVRLQATLEGLLALARSEPGQPPPIQRLPVDLSELAHEAGRRFEPVAAELGSRLETAIAPGLVVTGDVNLLRLVLFNLLDNSFKHGPPGEPVRLAAERRGDGIEVRVVNGGPPIPDALRGRIFDRFVHGAAERRDGAGGIGLSVVRWVAEAHGGTARLVDDAPETCFEVRLPAA